MGLNVVLDTNFLMIPYNFRVDIIAEMERLTATHVTPIVLRPVYEELMRLTSSSKPLIRRRASAALEVTSRKYKIIDIEKRMAETIDDYIFRVAKQHTWPVATADTALRKRLRAMNVAVFYLRQRSHLAVEGV